LAAPEFDNHLDIAAAAAQGPALRAAVPAFRGPGAA
jgi:hypothetical protein